MAVESFGGRYEPAHELTRTGSVVVHAAHDRWLHRPVVVAVHDPDAPSADATGVAMSRARFQRMGRMLMRVAHPNVAEAYDAGRQGDTVFVAFERPPRDLASELAGAPWDEDQVARLAAELTAALDVVHREGSCLDSLHPGCVGLSADGRVRLAPWPLAAPPAGWGGDGAWLAPERVAGGPPSIQADLWSAGAVLLTAMIGAGPGQLDEEGIAEMSGRIRQTRDPALVAATARSLSPDTSQRFGSAAAMSAALDADTGTATARLDAGSGAAPTVPRIRTRPLRVPAPRVGRWGRWAAAALAAGACMPFLALQLESAAPSVASCGPAAPHRSACPGHTSPAGRPSITAAGAAGDEPGVHAAAVGPVRLAAAVAPQLSAVAAAPVARPIPPRPSPAPPHAAPKPTWAPAAHPGARPAGQSTSAHGARPANHDRGSHDVGLGGNQSGRDR